MALGLHVTHTLGEARSVLGQLTGLQRKAAISALSRTGQQVRTAANREIRKQYPGLKAKAVSQALKVDRARVRDIEIAVVASGRRVRVIETQARQTRRGVSVRIGRARKLIPGAFIATMKSGHTGVFRRKGKARLPIDEVYTIAVSEAFATRIVVDTMRHKANEVFLPRFEHELERLAKNAAPTVVGVA